jgi:hypothetical protein
MTEAEETEQIEQISPGMEEIARQRAADRARAARWDLDIAVFLFAVLTIVIILLFQEIGIEVVAPIAIFGLAMVWLAGWRRGRQLYQRFYGDELARIMREARRNGEGVEETIEEKIQKALRQRWR